MTAIRMLIDLLLGRLNMSPLAFGVSLVMVAIFLMIEWVKDERKKPKV
jgi:hypothetical protein